MLAGTLVNREQSMSTPDEALNGLSVILITLNRAESLRQTLEGYARLTPPGLPWELILVDNNSTDETRQVAESFRDKLPIVYQLETTPGICEARNRGILSSHYDFLIFTDDDITLIEGWLCAYVQAALTHPDASYFGGPIALDLAACQPPAWALNAEGHLQDWLAGQFGEFNLTQISRIGLATPEAQTWLFYGGNMAYRKIIFERYGMFEPRLGNTGKRRFGAEEPYLHRKLYAAGEKPWYVPEALVWHRIRQDELTFRSRWRWAVSRGRGSAVMDTLSGNERPLNKRRTWRHLRQSVKQMPGLLSHDPFQRLKTISELTTTWAYEMQMLRLLTDQNDSAGGK